MRTWIFQSNPEKYRILDAIRELDRDVWTVRRHRARIAPGDRVYIWKSGDKAGIYCAGTVLTEVGEARETKDTLRFWRDPTHSRHEDPRVLVSYNHKLLDRPILRIELEPRGLGDLSVVRARTGTNFAVTEEQAAHLDLLVRSLSATGWLPPQDLSPAEFRAVHQDTGVRIYRNPETGKLSIRFQIGRSVPYDDRWIVPGRVLDYAGQGKESARAQPWNPQNLTLREACEAQKPVSVFEVLRGAQTGGRYRYHGEWFVTNFAERPIRERTGTAIRFTVGWAADSAPLSLSPVIDSENAAVDVAEPPTRMQCVTYRIVRDTEVTKSLKRNYRDRCQVCGEGVRMGDGRMYSEAHHIRPLGAPHNGLDVPGNVLILCPNHHAQFDYGALALDPKTLRLSAADPTDPYHDKALAARRHALDSDSLEYCWLSMFQRTGQASA